MGMSPVCGITFDFALGGMLLTTWLRWEALGHKVPGWPWRLGWPVSRVVPWAAASVAFCCGRSVGRECQACSRCTHS